MIVFGTVGAKDVRTPLLRILDSLGLALPTAHEEGDSWVVTPATAAEGRWQIGSNWGPHVWVTADAQGVNIGGDPWSYWPVYYAPVPDGVVFGTMLRPLLEVLRPRIDFVGCCQKAMIGTTLGTRTRHSGVARMRPGTTLRVERGGVQTEMRPYWEQPIRGNGEALAARLRHIVAGQLGDARAVTALLSGGLDSRVVVSLLVENGCTVNALNFAPVGNQDEVFAREFAAAAGARYFSAPRAAGELGHLRMAAKRLAEKEIRSDTPGVMWTGLAGSNLIGGVHLTERIIDLLRKEEFEEAAREHCAVEGYSLPGRLFSVDARTLERQVISDVAGEFAHYRTPDLGHAFTLYLLFNRERAGAAAAYETIAEHRLDIASPFIDEEVLRRALAIDARDLLNHRFYHDWLEYLPPVVRSVPWQSYPGHLPCPVPVEGPLLNQWQQARSYRTGVTRRTRRAALAVMAQGPEQVRRDMIALALALDTAHLRDCSHILQAAAAFQE